MDWLAESSGVGVKQRSTPGAFIFEGDDAARQAIDRGGEDALPALEDGRRQTVPALICVVEGEGAVFHRIFDAPCNSENIIALAEGTPVRHAVRVDAILDVGQGGADPVADVVEAATLGAFARARLEIDAVGRVDVGALAIY